MNKQMRRDSVEELRKRGFEAVYVATGVARTMTRPIVAAVLLASALVADGKAPCRTLTVDFATTTGPVKPVNAVGQPPMVGGPKDFWMFKYLKDAGIPYSRLHDVGGACGQNRYVDIPNLFRDFDADETRVENYDFAFTDALLRQLAENGVSPFFRLGVTIENYPDLGRTRVMPPKDFAKWARVCEHVIRHYTEGWANGLKLKIDYWEIWNEADLNPDKAKSMTWGGTFDEYCEFYGIVARHLKAKFPHLKIGGPASCGLYTAYNPMADAAQADYHVACCEKFLDYVRENKVPLDFFSFHSYSSARDVVRQVAAAQRLLKEHGLDGVETWLDEWLCYVSHESLGTAKQAAGIAAELIGLQNSAVSGACIYDAKCGLGDYSPLFNPMTYKPHKAYYAFTAFSELRKLGRAVEVRTDDADLWAAAASDGRRVALMLANETEREIAFGLDGKGLRFVSCRMTDGACTDAVVPQPTAVPPTGFCVMLFDVCRDETAKGER